MTVTPAPSKGRKFCRPQADLSPTTLGYFFDRDFQSYPNDLKVIYIGKETLQKETRNASSLSMTLCAHLFKHP